MTYTDEIKIRVTITGTYTVSRSDLPEDYDLPVTAPGRLRWSCAMQAATDEGDIVNALLCMDEDTVEVKFEEIQ